MNLPLSVSELSQNYPTMFGSPDVLHDKEEPKTKNATNKYEGSPSTFFSTESLLCMNNLGSNLGWKGSPFHESVRSRTH